MGTSKFRRRVLFQLVMVAALTTSTVSTGFPPTDEFTSGGRMTMCRSSVASSGGYSGLPAELFQLDACAGCYRYIPDGPTFFRRKWNSTIRAVSALPTLLSLSSNGTPNNNSAPFNPFRLFNVTFLINYEDGAIVLANASDKGNPLFSTFRDDVAAGKWTSCCAAAMECCLKQQPTSETPIKEAQAHIQAPNGQVDSGVKDHNKLPHCAPTWDGWTCWSRTPPDQIALEQCPSYIYFETEPPQCPRFAEKSCSSDGTWSKRKADYVPCGPVQELKQRTRVHIVAYAVSAAALLPALVLFYLYKQLNVYRIRLHKNMFISILLNAIFVITFKTVAILPPLDPGSPYRGYIKENSLGCRLLLMLTKYFRLTNYMWMFCEGFYLHRLIAAAFAEQKSFLIFYLIGWTFPLIPTGIYAAVRAVYYDEKCWVEPIEAYEWILNAPCLICLLANMIFLVNIIRILVLKLRTAHSHEPSQYRKAVRATLVLVPLFGLHFFITIYRPVENGCQWIEAYHYVNALLDGLQGALVAIIFCYANGEIHHLVKRSYKRFKEERRTEHRRRNKHRSDAGENSISLRGQSLRGIGMSGAEMGGKAGSGGGGGDSGGNRNHHGGKSVCIGFSTTHYSIGEPSPQTIKHQDDSASKSSSQLLVLPDVTVATIDPNRLVKQLKVDGQEPLVCETNLDNDIDN